MTRKVPPPSDEQTRRRMERQPQKNTKPEALVRSILHRLGHRFRVDNRDLPGSPDAANRSKKWAVFVHGCYWHHHEGCRRATVPKRNREFWLEKFRANRERDERVAEGLRKLGFQVVTIWECETKNPAEIQRRVQDRLP